MRLEKKEQRCSKQKIYLNKIIFYYKEDTIMEYVLKAHMPGLVARVLVEVGDKVDEGQEFAVINCMKTEMSCKTAKAGVVKEIIAAEWDEIDIDSPMVVLEVN